MSLRVDTASLITGALVCGNRGLGVLGSAVPSTGDDGPAYLYNDLSLPADASKEVRGLILTVPSAGTFFAYEDSSFTLDGAPNGTYTFTYRLFEDGVDKGTATSTIIISDPAASYAFIGTGGLKIGGTATTTFSLFPVAVAAAGDSKSRPRPNKLLIGSKLYDVIQDGETPTPPKPAQTAQKPAQPPAQKTQATAPTASDWNGLTGQPRRLAPLPRPRAPSLPPVPASVHRQTDDAQVMRMLRAKTRS